MRTIGSAGASAPRAVGLSCPLAPASRSRRRGGPRGLLAARSRCWSDPDTARGPLEASGRPDPALRRRRPASLNGTCGRLPDAQSWRPDSSELRAWRSRDAPRLPAASNAGSCAKSMSISRSGDVSQMRAGTSTIGAPGDEVRAAVIFAWHRPACGVPASRVRRRRLSDRPDDARYRPAYRPFPSPPASARHWSRSADRCAQAKRPADNRRDIRRRRTADRRPERLRLLPRPSDCVHCTGWPARARGGDAGR